MLDRQPAEPLLLVLSVLAAWRLTALVAYERGPFGAFDRLRRLAVEARLAALVTCFHCLALWVSAGVVLVVYELSRWSLLLWLSVAGGVSVVERWLGGAMTSGAEDGV